MTQKLRIGQVGLGYWGLNLARVFDDVADLTDPEVAAHSL